MQDTKKLSELGKLNAELAERVQRWTKHKKRKEVFTANLKEHFYHIGTDIKLEEEKLRNLIPSLEECGDWLLIHDYYLKKEHRLVGANFCKQHKLCGLCAIRRAAKGAMNLHDKAHQVLADKPHLKSYYVVLTVKNEPDLIYGMQKLKSGWKRIRTKIKDAKRALSTKQPEKSKYASALKSQFANIVAGAYSIEITWSKEEGWHPHMNLLLLSESQMSNNSLSKEWQSYVSDSYITYCDELDLEKDKWAFCEIMKYAMKFSELPFKQHKRAYLDLWGKRLKGSIGEFYGVDLEPNPEDETLEGEPFIEILLSYYNGEYRETRERKMGIEKRKL